MLYIFKILCLESRGSIDKVRFCNLLYPQCSGLSRSMSGIRETTVLKIRNKQTKLLVRVPLKRKEKKKTNCVFEENIKSFHISWPRFSTIDMWKWDLWNSCLDVRFVFETCKSMYAPLLNSNAVYLIKWHYWKITGFLYLMLMTFLN